MLTQLLPLWATEIRDFPFERGIKRYPLINTPMEYYSYLLDTLINKESAYVSVYSENERRQDLINYIFLDIDSANVKQTWDDINLFLKTFDPYITAYFSGSKGFHIYIYTEPTTLALLKPHRHQLLTILNTWLQSTLDSSVFLDIKRIKRVVYTYNKGLYKVPVSPFDTYEQIIERAKNPFRHINESLQLLFKLKYRINWKLLLEEPLTFFPSE